MNRERRHKRILSILQVRKKIEITDLSNEIPDVSIVTLRRDIAALAASGLVTRTHGHVQLPKDLANTHLTSSSKTRGKFAPKIISALDHLDAIVLPPISGKGSNALRRQIRRSGIPYLAESAPQEGGIYLGPDNFQASCELGKLAGSTYRNSLRLRVLIITHAELSNTQVRAEGFEQGLEAGFEGPIDVIRINGQGSYRSAFQAASDAFSTNTDIDIVFGVNEQSILAGMDAGEQHESRAGFYSIGGERAEFLAQVAEKGSLKAVAAMFPTVAGAIAIDNLALTLSGTPLPDQLLTPFAIITSHNLNHYYGQSKRGEWALRENIFESLVHSSDTLQNIIHKAYRIGFLPHFPAHDWYRAMIQSMQLRAKHYSMTLELIPPDQSIQEELTRLQYQIASAAADRVGSNETIIIGEGTTTGYLAQELRIRATQDNTPLAGLTVITNSFDVLFELANTPQITTVLTSGEYRDHPRCLVGPSLSAVFERMRADKAFLSVAGISTKFGVSAMDECRALAASCFINAARYTIVLADHTLIGADANHRIVRINDIHEIITDDAVLPMDRHELRSTGVELYIAGNNREQAGVEIPQVDRQLQSV